MKYFYKILIIIFVCLGISCSSTKSIQTSINDASSIEKAIKVSSVPEEYEYVRKVCANCKVISQALIFDKKKPYDLLKVKTAEGKEVYYYFDISKFYGKMF